MAGYTRVDTGNNIADGNVISAADLDNEFDGIQAAFNASTGHNHDGTTGEGAPILVLGPTQDVVVGASTVTPKTTNTVDIGSSSLKFKDLYMAGNASIGGTLAVTGVATLTAQPVLSSLTASRAVFTDGSKGLVSNAITGTGNVVMSASPTLTGTITAEALTLSGAVTASGGTANGVAYLNGSKVLTTGSGLQFDGTRLGVGGTAVELLDVFGTGQFRADLKVNGTFSLQRSSGSLYLPVAAYTNGSGSILSGGTKGDIVAFGNVGGDGIIFANANAEAMRLTSTGLGIGTSSPSYKLDVYGSGSPVIAVRSSATGDARLYVECAGTNSGWMQYTRSLQALQWSANGGTQHLTLDSAGNLGLGVTPSAWVLGKAFEVGFAGNALWGNATSSVFVTQNMYYDGNFRYKNTAAASNYQQESGAHKWFTAPSGTAGNAISFTQAMTLDASGNLIVGDTSQVGSSKISMTVNPSLANVLAAKTSTNGDVAAFRILSSDGNEQGAVNVNTSGQNMTFRVANTERARIDSSGNLLVGTTSFTYQPTNGVTLAGGSLGSVGIGHATGTGSGNGYANFTYGGTNIGSISQNGTTAVSYNTTSDYRLKTVIGSVSGAGSRIDALEPIEYEWKVNGERTRGFLAHKFQEVYAGSVTGTKDAVDKEGKPVYQAMQASSSEVIADLVAEIQSLRKRLAALESK